VIAPSLEHVIDATNARAARVEERCNYVVTGFVLTHHSLGKKAVVDMASVRWFPNVDEFMHMMTGRKITPGPGLQPTQWGVDEIAPAAPAIAPAPAAAAPTRPVLTAPPSARLLESTEDALGQLAHELGCVYDVSVPHNAGWFVPGKPTACASAYDAIRGLVASLKAGGTVYEPKPAAPAIAEPVLELVPVEVPKRKPAPAPAIEQGALF
jgi:hypothetical protein